MKKILLVLLAGCLLYGCADKKAEEKAAMDEVLAVHEKVMNADEQLMKNKMELDTLLKQDNLPGKDTATMLSKQLTAAEDNMANWMHNFDADKTGKTHEETMAYISSQKKQIMTIDSAIKVAIDQSNQYLLKVKKK